MRFARVTATLTPTDPPAASAGDRRLTVRLDDGRSVRTVRDERVRPVPPPPGEADGDGWALDQYLQETIANELAEQGWEAVGLVRDDDDDPDERRSATAPSGPTYLVRML